jgi:hypothetical protein
VLPGLKQQRSQIALPECGKRSKRPVSPQAPCSHGFFLLVNEGPHVAYLAFLIAVTPADKLRLSSSFQSSHVTFVTLVNFVALSQGLL